MRGFQHTVLCVRPVFFSRLAVSPHCAEPVFQHPKHLSKQREPSLLSRANIILCLELLLLRLYPWLLTRTEAQSNRLLEYFLSGLSTRIFLLVLDCEPKPTLRLHEA